MRTALSIGDFSRITHLSIKTLRRYHDAGLLEPAEIDPFTGYRYYTTSQVPTAQVIRRFRDLGMPVKEVGEVLATGDPEARSALIAVHLQRLEAQLEQTREAVSSLRRLLTPEPAPIVVEHRTVLPQPVAAIRGTVDLDEVLQWYSDAMVELGAALDSAGLTPDGPAGGLYDNELFTEEHGNVLVYAPVRQPPKTGRVEPYELAGGDLAITVHRGSHDDIDVTYGRLGSYVADNEFTVAGPVRERYLVGPRDTADESAWRTEIGWPVFRTTS
jgi:DNA-binding transcriptional MerR regulator